MHPVIRIEGMLLELEHRGRIGKEIQLAPARIPYFTAKETELFTNKIPLAEKRITAEFVCITCGLTTANMKARVPTSNGTRRRTVERSRRSLESPLDGRLDVVATDRPTLEEKQ